MTRRLTRRSVTCWPPTPPPAARWRWSGPSGGPKAEGEQSLLDTMLSQHPGAFTRDRIFVMDRNFPGADRVARMLATGTHVLIRVKSDLTLNRIGGFLADGSYYSYLACGCPGPAGA